MSTLLPEVKHIYHNGSTLVSPRWQHYRPRDGDIIIATAPKSGTTWMQNIVMHLIFQDLEFRKVYYIFPWFENNGTPVEEVLAQLEEQDHRHCIKTHLPLDGLVYHPNVKYIVVSRDGRDAFMSMWNHYYNTIRNQTEPNFIDNIRDFWNVWITKSIFEWQNEGYPFHSPLYFSQTWWDFRHLPNILFVHYNNLLSDLEGEIHRIAHYLEIEVSEELIPKIADAVSFDTMKVNADKVAGDFDWLDGGGKKFINKGTNSRWRDVLTEDDLKQYAAAVEQALTSDCAHWLEHGHLLSTQ